MNEIIENISIDFETKFLSQKFLPNFISDIIACIIFYRFDMVAIFRICSFVHDVHQVFSSVFEK